MRRGVPRYYTFSHAEHHSACDAISSPRALCLRLVCLGASPIPPMMKCLHPHSHAGNSMACVPHSYFVCRDGPSDSLPEVGAREKAGAPIAGAGQARWVQGPLRKLIRPLKPESAVRRWALYTSGQDGSGRGRATAGRRAGGRESPHPFVPGFDGAVGHDLIVCLEHTHTNRGDTARLKKISALLSKFA